MTDQRARAVLDSIDKTFGDYGKEVDKIAAALADERRRVMEEAAKEVCMYCGGRALGYRPISGPNQSGNYIHAAEKTTSQDVLCRASAIHWKIKAHAGQEG